MTKAEEAYWKFSKLTPAQQDQVLTEIERRLEAQKEESPE